MRSKGISKTFESIVAILSMLTVFIIYFSAKQTIPDFEVINREMKAFTVMKTLVENNEFRQWVLANDTEMLENKILTMMPADINYEIKVCSPDCSKPNVTSENMYSVNYIVAGDVKDFRPRQIVLYMWT
jgi:hypothetical protein